MVAAVLCGGLRHIDSLSVTDSLRPKLLIQLTRCAGAASNGITLISVIPVSLPHYTVEKRLVLQMFLAILPASRFDLDLKLIKLPALTKVTKKNWETESCFEKLEV